MDLRPGIATLSMDGTCPRAILPGPLGGGRAARSTTTAIFPNMLLSLHPDYMLTHTLWPIAPDRTINVCEWHFQPVGARARRRFSATDCVEFWDMTNKQDWHVCELSQAGIASPRLHCPARTRTARICSTRSIASSWSSISTLTDGADGS